MNCFQCGEHILATMQVMWGSNPFHADCIGEAIAQKNNIPSRESNLPENYFGQLEDSFEEDEFFHDDAEVDDEILNQIPAQQPDYRPEVAIADVMANVNRQFIAERQPSNGSKLIVHAGAIRVNRSELAGFPLPEETDTFKPIGHDELVNTVEEALAFRHIGITREEFAVSPDGMKFFSVLQVNAQYEGVNFAIGLRNSNNKSLRVGIVSGYRVFCCDNLAFSGDFNPMLQKHSKNLDLIESVSIAIDRIQRSWQPLRAAIDYKRNRKLTGDEAMIMLYKLFTENKFPITLFKTVNDEFFNNPSFHEFKGRTLWSLENAATTAIKKLSPIAQYEQTARLGKFISQQISTT